MLKLGLVRLVVMAGLLCGACSYAEDDATPQFEAPSGQAPGKQDDTPAPQSSSPNPNPKTPTGTNDTPDESNPADAAPKDGQTPGMRRARSSTSSSSPVASQNHEPILPPTPEVQIVPAPQTTNAPGSVYQLEYLPPGGLRSPAALVTQAPNPMNATPEHGMNFGAVRIYPGMSYDLTYTDNSLRTNTHRQHDELEEFGPNVTIAARPDEHVQINAAYAFLWHDYIENTAKDFFSHSAVGTVALKDIFLDGLNFTFGDTYLTTANTNVLETEILQFSRYALNKAFMAANYNSEHFRLAMRYDFDNLSYFSIPQDSANSHDQSGTIDASYRLNQTFDLFATYSILRTYHDVAIADSVKDEDRHTWEMGFDAKFYHLTVSAAGGYTASQLIYSGPQDDGAVASASINYDIDEHFTVGGYGGVGLSQNAREGRIVGQSRDLLLEGEGGEPVSFGAYVHYRPWQHIRLSANVDRTISQGVLTGRTEDLLFGGSAELTLTERAHIDASIFRDLSKPDSTGQSTINSFSTTARYDITRRFSLLFSATRSETIDPQKRNLSVDEGRIGLRFAW